MIEDILTDKNKNERGCVYELKPVKRYKESAYPDKRKVMEKPYILKTVPGRWKGNIPVGIALASLLAMTTTGCAQYDKRGDSSVLHDIDTAGKNQEDKTKKEKPVPGVAPIFIHGDGRGSFGCVSVAPPAFLSEEEAFDVIYQEAQKYGIIFKEKGPVLDDVKIPETLYYLNANQKVEGSRNGSLELDGYDEGKNIGFEFISREDYKEWHVEQEIRSSVDVYDFLSTAEILAKGMEGKTDDLTIGVFYNPMPRFTEEEIRDEDSDWEQKQALIREQAAEQLREQVRDFLEWLKGEGII